jgi:hypothetical protein
MKEECQWNIKIIDKDNIMILPQIIARVASAVGSVYRICFVRVKEGLRRFLRDVAWEKDGVRGGTWRGQNSSS